MDNPAALADVVANFERPLTSGESAAVPAWLNIAWSKFKKGVAAAEARIGMTDTEPAHIDVDEVKTTLAEMVIRRLRNPDGRRSWNDDTYGETVDSALSSGAIYLAEDEKAQYALPGTGAVNGMYSIPLSR